MSFASPMGLLALLGLIPLVAAYFLRRRQRPLIVSALFLWREPRPTAEAGPRVERYQRELSLLLEGLALIAGALYLADLRWNDDAHARPLVLVVDGSLSLSATTPSGPVMTRIRGAAAEAVERTKATEVTVIVSGDPPRILTGPAASPARALSALDTFVPRAGTHELTSALALAQDLGTGTQAGATVLLTDGPLVDARSAAGVEVIAVGEAADNVAFVAAHREDAEGEARIVARVVNHSGAAREVPVEVWAEAPRSGGGDGEPPQRVTQVVRIAPGRTARIDVTLRTTGDVHLALADDALPEDGRLRLAPSPQSPVHLVLADGVDARGALARGLERFARVTTAVHFGAPPPEAKAGVQLRFRGRSAPPGGGGLRTDPETEGDRSASGPSDSGGGNRAGAGRDLAATGTDVTVGAPGAQRTFLGPFFAEPGERLLEDVSLAGVRWTAGTSPPGRGLLRAGETVLMSIDERGTVHLNLDLGRSNLHRTAGWPVLLGNLVQEARNQSPGFPRRALPLGAPLVVVTDGTGPYQLEFESSRRPLLGSGRLERRPPPEPGRVRLLRAEQELDVADILPLAPLESDLRGRTSGRWATEATPRSPAAVVRASFASGAERSPLLLVLLLLLLLADFWLTRSVRA